MKRILFVFAAGIVMAACNQSDAKTDPNAEPKANEMEIADSLTNVANFTTIEWIDSTSKNLGKVAEGAKVEVTYLFKNTGDKPLVITNASASCGCTIPNPPKDPIAPGAEGKLTAEFNSQGRAGTNMKEIFVTANTKPTANHTLKFQVEVEGKEAAH